jgi:putative flippase GtrA
MEYPGDVPDKKLVDFGSIDLSKLIRFILVGLLNTAVGYGAFFVLSYVLNYLIALIISHFIGVANSYVWNKYWTFKTRQNYLHEFIKFNIVYMGVLISNIIILGILVDGLMFNPRLGQLFVLPIVTIISYFGHKYWSFKQLNK